MTPPNPMPAHERPAHERAGRWRPWTWLVPLIGPPLALVALRALDPVGDRGLANVLGAGLGLLVVVGWLVLFAWRSGHPLRWRLGVPAAVIVAVAGFAGLVRIEGVRGDMVPVLRSRFAPRGPAPEVGSLAAVERSTSAEVVLGVSPGRDFPGFLGAARDGRVPGVVLRDWNAHPPRLLWRAPIGAGWSGFAVAAGWAVTMEQGTVDEIVSLRDLRTGQLVWTRHGGAAFEHPLGGSGPRATPAIGPATAAAPGGCVIVLGARGWLACLDGRDGRIVWEHDLRADFGVSAELEFETLQYGRSGSPLIVDSRVIVPVGGVAGGRQAGLVAYDLATGAVLWEGPPRAISYSSPAHARLGGVEQVLIVNEDSVSAHALEDGHLLWEWPWPGHSSGDSNVSQAVPIVPGDPDDAGDLGAAGGVLVSKGYGGGGLLLELVPGAAGLEPRERWRNARVLRTKFTNVVRHGQHLYGLGDGILECVSLARGERAWRDGRYGHGQLLLVGDTLLVTAEDGRVVAVEATPDEADHQRGEFQGLEGKCWAVPAFSAGVLLLRNETECAAWELAVEDA